MTFFGFLKRVHELFSSNHAISANNLRMEKIYYHFIICLLENHDLIRMSLLFFGRQMSKQTAKKKKKIL